MCVGRDMRLETIERIRKIRVWCPSATKEQLRYPKRAFLEAYHGKFIIVHHCSEILGSRPQFLAMVYLLLACHRDSNTRQKQLEGEKFVLVHGFRGSQSITAGKAQQRG